MAIHQIAQRLLGWGRGSVAALLLVWVLFGLPVIAFLYFPLSVIPWTPTRKLAGHLGNHLIQLVSTLLLATFRITRLASWQIEGLGEISDDRTCLLISNHQSWTDPLLMHAIIDRRLPARRFLIKRALAYIPIFGQALVAVGMPPLRRTNAAAMARNPALFKKDLQSLAKACRHFETTTSAITLFPEGTRQTAEKYRKNRSPYRHLLRPNSGGVAVILQQLPTVDRLYDCTIVYDRKYFTFWDFLCGRARCLQFHIRRLDIPPELREKNAKAAIRKWLNDIWAEKDERIHAMQPSTKSTKN